jgi:S-adenosylmethionine:tRNA ribosyltransferase-isomerase
MRTDELDYDLPSRLIAQRPLERRDASNLLMLDRFSSDVSHRVFSDLPELLAPRSLLVVNDSRVIPARLECTRDTGGRIEVLLVRRITEQGRSETWSALIGGSGRVRPGLRLRSASLTVRVQHQLDGPLFQVELQDDDSPVREAIVKLGRVPLPPYIRRQPDDDDLHRYQTVYASADGSAAAPTAGLHFTPELLELLEARGHEVVKITLHVGPGTFRPVRTDELEDHSMHSEWVDIGESAAIRILAAKAERRRVVAVGTTVVRTLEGVVERCGALEPYAGPVNLFIRPGHDFAVVEELITNLHLPRSTLLALVMALAGTQNVRRAYAEAIANNYRFYSYGDAMYVRSRRACSTEVPPRLP